MSALWGLVDPSGVLRNRVEEGWVRPPGSELSLVSPEVADALPLPPPYVPPEPEPAQAPVPEEVSPAQARIVLLQAGLLDSVQAAIAGASMTVQLAWEYGVTLKRHSPTVAQLGGALGLSDAQIDDLFRAAAAVEL